MIGVLTAIVGDLASQFGCWVGLKDAVTAISFVALGTSVPGQGFFFKSSSRNGKKNALCIHGDKPLGKLV